MSDYTQVTNFTDKDSLSSGDPEKVILGADVDGELSAIAAAIATKYDSTDIASDVEAKALTVNTKLITPLRLNDVLGDNAGALLDINGLTDPGADRILYWDNNEPTVTWLSLDAELEISSGSLGFAEGVAGDGLAFSAGALSVNVGEGIFIETDTLKLSDSSAGAGNPIALTDGVFSFDMSSLVEIGIEAFDQAADGTLVSDGGTLKLMPYDKGGIKVVDAADADQTFAETDAMTMQVLDSTTDREWTIPPSTTFDFDIGTVIIAQSINTAEITLTAGTGVVLSSTFNTASTTATSDTVRAGGRGILVKVANDEWTLSGDITD